MCFRGGDHHKTENQGTRFRLHSGCSVLTAAQNVHDLQLLLAITELKVISKCGPPFG